LKDGILRRIARSGAIGHLSGFETAGLASAATVAGALWVGVSVPTLSPLHGSRGGADRSVSIALESALLGIDDASSRSLRAATLADRLGALPSGRLLPTPEQLRVAGTELAARVESSHVRPGRLGILTVALRAPLIVTGVPGALPAGGSTQEPMLSVPAPPAPSPEPGPAPVEPPPAVRVQSDVPQRAKPVAAVNPQAGGKSSRPGMSTASDDEPALVDGPVATRPAPVPDAGVAETDDTISRPAATGPPPSGAAGSEPSTAASPAAETVVVDAGTTDPAPSAGGDSSADGQTSGSTAPPTDAADGNAVQPGSSAAGDGNGNAFGQGNGNGNGNAVGQGNGNGNGNGKGNAVGQGTGAPNGNAVGQGGGNGNAYGHTK
jgi:hypothetical protein